MNSEKNINKKLTNLVEESNEISSKIKEITKKINFNEILVQRMKRKQAEVRNKIIYLQSLLREDIVA